MRAVVIGAVGGLVGGIAGGAFAVAVTQLIKELLAVVTRQDDWLLLVLPLVGVALATVVLHLIGHGDAVQHIEAQDVDEPAPRRFRLWRTFPADLARADLTADVVRSAGREEAFPWRLAPVRAVAIMTTVGLGAPMGTEAPAAHLGVAAGAALGEATPKRGGWGELARPAALGGGAAGVAALIGLPLVGFAFMLELGRRRRVPISPERVIAAAMGALAGWTINIVFDLNLIRLVVPDLSPGDVPKALLTALLVGLVSGSVCSLTGAAIYRCRRWEGNPALKLGIGVVGLAAAALAIGALATATAAVGPGGSAVAWAETFHGASATLFAVALLRACATAAAVLGGGCGGVFVPFLAIGDMAGRAFAPTLGVSSDLAGAAGAAAGIAGGYRLPVTAAMMVIGIGGPASASLTCLATVGVAAIAGVGSGLALDQLTKFKPAGASRRES
ncbi:MAG TPA: chloride channel protein [Acidimicrobiales bacterium]|nr:chloride channel protein [Acidimicrobiales bacterium]